MVAAGRGLAVSWRPLWRRGWGRDRSSAAQRCRCRRRSLGLSCRACGARLTAGRIDRTQHGNQGGRAVNHCGAASLPVAARCSDGRCRGGGVRPVSALPSELAETACGAVAGTRSALDDRRCTAGGAETGGDGCGLRGRGHGVFRHGAWMMIDGGRLRRDRTHRLRLIGLDFLLVGHPQDPTVIGWGGLHHGMQEGPQCERLPQRNGSPARVLFRPRALHRCS